MTPESTRSATATLAATRGGLLAAWGNAWLAGACSFDDVVTNVAGTDAAHRVSGLPDARGESVPLGWALGEVRRTTAGGVGPLRLVLPVPGDPRGLPPAPVLPDPARNDLVAAALDVGAAVLAGSPDGSAWLGLVPFVEVEPAAPEDGRAAVHVLWHAHAWSGPPGSHQPQWWPAVLEADQGLRLALLEAVAGADVLGLARDGRRPEGASQERPAVLPPGHDGRAVRLLATADALARALDLVAAGTPDVARSAAQHSGIDALLRPLRAAIRDARLAACNVPDEARRHGPGRVTPAPSRAPRQPGRRPGPA